MYTYICYDDYCAFFTCCDIYDREDGKPYAGASSSLLVREASDATLPSPILL